MTTQYNRSTGMRFRELCALTLKAHGLDVATSYPWKPSEIIGQNLDDADFTNSDIRGLPQFAIKTRASVSPAGVSGALAEAEAIAAREGRRYPVLFAWRSGGIGAEHLAVMPLSAWAELVREALAGGNQDSESGAASAVTGREDYKFKRSSGAATVS